MLFRQRAFRLPSRRVSLPVSGHYWVLIAPFGFRSAVIGIKVMESRQDKPVDRRHLSHSRSKPLTSIADLSIRLTDPTLGRFNRMYSVQNIPTTPLKMDNRAWAETSRSMKAPREMIENQALIAVRDLYLGFEAIFNPLRGFRTPAIYGPDPADVLDQERVLNGCSWCEPDGLWADEWGQIQSDDGRVYTRANWARQSAVSGIVFGRQMHNLLRLTQQEFVSLFATAEKYISAARKSRPAAGYWMIFINGGRKSAGSVPHAHLQVVGREDRHFAYPETVAARCPEDYWRGLRIVHEDLNLLVRQDRSIALANVVPMKERDITVFSPSILEGAQFVYDVLQALIRRGTNSWSLAAILSPGYVTNQNLYDRFSSWPPVLWRLLDRGDLRTSHGDFGCMELWGSSVVATDPFVVTGWLKEAAGG
jgi:diadenosine tetraphosphate (Ap4A) HIT family hydrolase